MTVKNLQPILLRIFTLACILFAAGAEAVPFNLSGESSFRDNRHDLAIGGTIRDTLQISVAVNSVATGDRVPGAAVTASRPTSMGFESFSLGNCDAPGQSIFNCYFALIPLPDSDPALRDARLGADWTIDVVSGLDTGTTTIPAYGTGSGTDALPFAVMVDVVDPSTTPTVTWAPPVPLADLLLLNDGNVDRWRIRFNDSDFVQLFDSERDGGPFGLNDLPLDTTSFTLPAGFITEPGDYIVSVMLEGIDPMTRSRVREPFSVLPQSVVPEPTTLLLLGVGLTGLGFSRRRLQ